LRYDFVRTWLTRVDEAPFERIETLYNEMEEQGRRAIANASVRPQKVTIKRAADMRYIGQEHAVTVPLPASVFACGDRHAIKRLFDATHLARYGTSAPEEGAEIVSLRATVIGALRKPRQGRINPGRAVPPVAASTGTRPVFFSEIGFQNAKTWDRSALLAGNRIRGPALIEEHASTTVLMPGDSCEVDPYSNLTITVGLGKLP
jgi:N-methylhydantoinase A